VAQTGRRRDRDTLLCTRRGQALAGTIFLFFACLSPAVTFGLLFSEATEKHLGVVEMILSSGISGIIYSLFSGQPLCILGATGPELAYTVRAPWRLVSYRTLVARVRAARRVAVVSPSSRGVTVWRLGGS